MSYKGKCYSLTVLCGSCKHINPDKEEWEQYTCEAFPLGIPTEICFNDFDHRNPHPDDNGIHYQRNPRLPEDVNPTKETLDSIFERRRLENDLDE